jgi:LacI family transcriptional regulator
MSDIIIDFRGGMMQMVTHLKELGHRNLGFIGGTAGLETSRVRRESFMDAIVQLGLTSRAEWMVEGNYKIDGGFAAMAQILAQPEIPTAIVTANDLTAIGAMRAAYEKGLRIPDNISIAGLDDIEMSDIVFPPLTTLRISRKDYARMLFEALRETGKDLSKPGPQFRLPMSLVVRRSTGPAPASHRDSSRKAPTRRAR